MEKIIIFLRQFGIILLVGFFGCGILIYGLWGQFFPTQTVVEIVKSPESVGLDGQVVVDVGGAVENPGLYKLSSGSRIGDAIVAASGLSASADREWVAQSINLAEILVDGKKIYIPTKGSREVMSNGAKKININKATIEELSTLNGIGEVRAKTIIDNRPYSDTGSIVEKAKIPKSTYEKIKDQITVY